MLDNGAFHQAKALQWPANVAPVFLPPYRPERNPIERLWRDLKDTLADSVTPTLDQLSDAVSHLLQGDSPAALQSLTGYAYFVQAVATARQVINSSSRGVSRYEHFLLKAPR